MASKVDDGMARRTSKPSPSMVWKAAWSVAILRSRASMRVSLRDLVLNSSRAIPAFHISGNTDNIEQTIQDIRNEGGHSHGRSAADPGYGRRVRQLRRGWQAAEPRHLRDRLRDRQSRGAARRRCV